MRTSSITLVINWRDIFELTTKRSNRNHVVTFDSHLKTTSFSILILPVLLLLCLGLRTNSEC